MAFWIHQKRSEFPYSTMALFSWSFVRFQLGLHLNSNPSNILFVKITLTWGAYSPRLLQNPMNQVTWSLTVHHLLQCVNSNVSNAVNTTEEDRDHKYYCSHYVWAQLQFQWHWITGQKCGRKFTLTWNGNKTLLVDYSRITSRLMIKTPVCYHGGQGVLTMQYTLTVTTFHAGHPQPRGTL